MTQTDRRQRKFLKNADNKQKHSSSWKTSGCAFLFYLITPVSSGDGRCSMHLNLQREHRMSFVEAYHKLDETEYYLDILCTGDSHERAEVVSYLLADGGR